MKRLLAALILLLAAGAAAQQIRQYPVAGSDGIVGPGGGPKTNEQLAPVAAFSCTPLTGSPPLEITCTDTTTNQPTSWAWDFGDSGTSTSQNPTHEYANAGTYTVTLTATNVGGSDDEEKVDYVTAAGPFGGHPTLGDVLHYWKMEDATDSIRTSPWDLTNNGATFAAGIIGNDAVIDYSPGYIDRAATSLPVVPVSISLWFKSDPSAASPSVLSFRPNSGGSGNIEGEIYINGGSIACRFGNGGGAYYQLTSDPTAGDVWRHVVAWMDVDKVPHIRVNNTSQDNGLNNCCMPGSPYRNAASIWRNDGAFGAQAFVGALGEIGIWGRILTPQERTDLYNGGAGLTY